MLNAPTPEKTRVCPNCSDPELGLKDKFCSSCGTAVPLMLSEEELVEDEETSIQDSQQEETENVAEEDEQPAPSEPSSPQPAQSSTSSRTPRQCSACLRMFLKHRDAVNHLRGSLSCKESGGTVCFIKKPKVLKRKGAVLDKEEEVVKVQSKDGSIEKVVRVIRIVRDNIGRVMGVGGESINEVQNLTGTKIDVRDGEDEMNKITITGTEESVNEAVSMVKQLATGRSRPRSWKNESEDRRLKRKPPKAYDETAELFGLNPYKRAGRGRGRGMRNFRGTSEPPFMGSREPPYMGAREPPFMGSREPPFMGSKESSIERAKWSGGADRRGSMGEGRFENDLPPWARKSFRAETDGWGARSRPSRPDGFYRGRGFNGGREMGGDDYMDRGWGGPSKSGDWGGPPKSSDWSGQPKSSDWVTTTRDTGGWGKSKSEPDIEEEELPKPKPKKYKRDEVAELFGIRQPPPDGRRRWAPYRREALGRGRWAPR